MNGWAGGTPWLTAPVWHFCSKNFRSTITPNLTAITYASGTAPEPPLWRICPEDIRPCGYSATRRSQNSLFVSSRRTGVNGFHTDLVFTFSVRTKNNAGQNC